ncbi:MAG TPA: nitronate monooxygenase, partial [Flavobacteriales bacterium]|nr:nitronate monooxygenase [Flavobacteriales bacterium]
AGGICDGRSMLAAIALGADGVQVGSRFVCSEESSAHDAFKQQVSLAKEGDTQLTLKEITPVRLLKNDFYKKVQFAYSQGVDVEGLKELLGRGRAKKGMFEGDLVDGELEIGQVSGRFSQILPAATILNQMIKEFESERQRLCATIGQ